jgi:IstB-like ATP binding protein
MTKSRAKVGERLPYLLGKLKAPRVLQRLEQTAERARAEQWPYEQFLEALLEAEVFARDASGARMRIRHAAFPALKTLDDFDWTAQPAAEKPLVLHLAQLAWVEERANVCFFGPPGTGKTLSVPETHPRCWPWLELIGDGGQVGSTFEGAAPQWCTARDRRTAEVLQLVVSEDAYPTSAG